MKQIIRFFSLVAILATSIFLFTKCEKEYSTPSMENEFESISTLVMPKIAENRSIEFKSASVPQIDSIEIYLYYLNEGSWTEVSPNNFNSGSEANLNFANPLKAEYSDTIQLPYVTKAQCKFVFQGYDLSGNKTFIGQVEEDLRDASEGWILASNLFETKSYLGLKVLELVPSEDSCVFSYEYTLKQIDSSAMLNNIGTFGSTFPDFQFETSGNTVTGQLIVDGETVLLNGSPVSNYADYIDISENWNASAPEGVDWTMTSYRDGTQISNSVLTAEWLSLGENNYVQVLNSTSGLTEFTIIHNEDVFSNWEINTLDLNEGLVAYYDFEEVSGNLLDLTGNGHDGTNNGATQGVSGKVGNAYDFDGSNDYINLGPSNNIVGGLQDMTLIVWVNSRQIDYRGLIIASSNGINGTDESVRIQFWDVNNTIENAFFGSNGVGLGGVGYSSNEMNANIWYCLTNVLASDSVRFYIDGIKVGSTQRSSSDPISNATNTLVLGRLGTYSTYYFDGLLDEVGIWNRALSDLEVSKLYNSGQGLTYSDF